MIFKFTKFIRSKSINLLTKNQITMKTLGSILIVCLSFIGMAQPSTLGMGSSYTVSPSSALTLSPGIAYNSTITIACNVVNTGTNTFLGGSVSMMRAVKSGTFTSAVAMLGTYSVSPILAGDSAQIVVSDTLMPSDYLVNGNGNTIVVWPMSPSAATTDSLRAGPIFVNDPTGLEELDRLKLYIYPNPVSRFLSVRPENGVVYQELFVYNLQWQLVMRKPYEEENDLGGLQAGVYFIQVSDSGGRRYSSRFVKE